jgi:hypothetical protein
MRVCINTVLAVSITVILYCNVHILCADPAQQHKPIKQGPAQAAAARLTRLQGQPQTQTQGQGVRWHVENASALKRLTLPGKDGAGPGSGPGGKGKGTGKLVVPDGYPIPKQPIPFQTQPWSLMQPLATPAQAADPTLSIFANEHKGETNTPNPRDIKGFGGGVGAADLGLRDATVDHRGLQNADYVTQMEELEAPLRSTSIYMIGTIVVIVVIPLLSIVTMCSDSLLIFCLLFAACSLSSALLCSPLLCSPLLCSPLPSQICFKSLTFCLVSRANRMLSRMHVLVSIL